MNIFICDDDILAAKQLSSYIDDYFSLNCYDSADITLFYDGLSLLNSSTVPDILFLDIEMPEFNGISIADTFKNKYPELIIIIVTSHREYLDDAMNIRVFRYLDKPIARERLYRNLKSAITELNQTGGSIIIESKNNFITVSKSDIICAEAQLRHVNIYTSDITVESVKNMSFWENTLSDYCFFKTHRSYIINLNHVTSFDKNTVRLYDNKFTACVSRSAYNNFKNTYLQFIEHSR